MKLLNKEDVLKCINYAMWDTDDVPQSEAQIALKWLRIVRDNINQKIKEVPAIPIEQLREWQKQYGNKCTYGHIMKLVEEWEKENG